jgi:hypothetical protein
MTCLKLHSVVSGQPYSLYLCLPLSFLHAGKTITQSSCVFLLHITSVFSQSRAIFFLKINISQKLSRYVLILHLPAKVVMIIRNK